MRLIASSSPFSQSNTNPVGITSLNNRPVLKDAIPLARLVSIDSMHKTSPLRPNVKFGFACGICPACLATTAVKGELDKIGNLKNAIDNLEDVSIEVGKASERIRKQGALTGADSGTAYIGNEDGTRVQRISSKDMHFIQQAVLPRIYLNSHDPKYRIVSNHQHTSGGINNGLYKALIKGLSQVDKTEIVTEATSPPALQSHLFEKLDKNPITLGIYHHLAEGKKFRETGESDPALLGYVSASKLEKHAIFVPSLREMPGFEEFGATPGGLMNVIGMAAKHDGVHNIKIAVEPWQHELKSYIQTLKKDYGWGVRKLAHEKAVPAHYREGMQDAQMTTGTELYEIPLAHLKTELKQSDYKKSDAHHGQLDTDLLEKIKLPDPGRDLLFDRIKKTIEILPRLLKLTFNRSYLLTLKDFSNE